MSRVLFFCFLEVFATFGQNPKTSKKQKKKNNPMRGKRVMQDDCKTEGRDRSKDVGRA